MFDIPFGTLPSRHAGMRTGGRRVVHPMGIPFDEFRDQLGQFQTFPTFATFATDGQADQSRGQPATADAVLRELPAIKVTSYDIEQNDSPDCVICLEPLVVGEQANRIPCGHLFHEVCVRDWLKTSNQCPVCRYELPTDDPRYEQERRSHSGCRRPRLRRADLTAKSVRELRHLARHLGVSVAGCIEKDELVQRLAVSDAIELIFDDTTHERPTTSASVPDSCKLSSTQLANMNFNEIRHQMMQMGVDYAGCHQKRDLIQRLIDSGRVTASSHSAPELVPPSQHGIASEPQSQSDGEARAVEVASSEGGDDEAISIFRHGATSNAGLKRMEACTSVAKE